MKTTAGTLRVLLAASFASLLTVGCVGPQARSTRYNQICEVLPPENSGEARIEERASPNPNWYANGSNARDIALARHHLLNVRHAFENFECGQEIDNRNLYDRPLLITAIVAGAAALAKANAYIIGGIGLTAGSIATFKSYNHPDADRDAFLTAYAQLTCAYDETHSLAFNGNVDKQIYDRDALQIAIGVVSQDITPLTEDQSKLTPTQKTVLKAATTALDAGNKALDAINKSLSDYNRISTVLYKTVDSIDIAARSVNKTNGTYAGFSSSIKDAYAAAGQSKAVADDAKKQVSAADATQKAATESVDSKTPADNKSSPAKRNAVGKLLFGGSQIAEQVKALDIKSSCANNTVPDDACLKVEKTNGVVTDAATKAPLRAPQIASDAASGDIAKLIHLATLATDSMPTPSYADIIANTLACVPKS